MEVLYFSQPYYTTPAAFFVHAANTTYTTPADLSGKKVGGCAGCTYDAYIAGTLQIPGETFEYIPSDAEYVGYDSDLPALQDLALGDGVRLDAVLTAQPTGAGAIIDNLPVKQLGSPVYFEYLAAAFDKNSTLDSAPLVLKISEVILSMLGDLTDFNRIILTYRQGSAITFSDIGRVIDTIEEPRSLARLDGRAAISLLIRKQSGTNTVEVVDRVMARLETIKPTLPRTSGSRPYATSPVSSENR